MALVKEVQDLAAECSWDEGSVPEEDDTSSGGESILVAVEVPDWLRPVFLAAWSPSLDEEV